MFDSVPVIFIQSRFEKMKHTFVFLGSFLLFLNLVIHPVFAGQLFPPANSGSNTSCPAGEVLRWESGSVICVNPFTINGLDPAKLKNVNVSSCPIYGQLMVGIKDGVAVCNYPNIGAGNCPSGQVMTGIGSYGIPTCTSLASLGGTGNWSNAPAGTNCGAYTNAPGAPGTVTCQGHNPYNGCPGGFTRIGGDFKSPGNRYFYTCVKN